MVIEYQVVGLDRLNTRGAFLIATCLREQPDYINTVDSGNFDIRR